MILKVVGQFVFAALMVQMVPVNAGYYEWQAGINSASAVAGVTMDELNWSKNTFPISDERELNKPPVKIDEDSYGVVTTAQSAIVVDAKSGTVLFEKHPDQVRSIGSVTKLMSALVFLESEPDLTEIVELDPALDLVEGGRVYLAFYDGLTIKDVLRASIIGSDNTATYSLMRLAGMNEVEFLSRMNKKASELGLVNTVFNDPTGIDSTNVSTARELVLLLHAANKNKLLQSFMQTQKISITHDSGRVVTIENTNKLLETFLNEGVYVVTGGKTGFLPLAGYVLATSVEKNGNEIYTVVLGSASKDDRVNDAKGLSAWAFKTYSWESN